MSHLSDKGKDALCELIKHKNALKSAGEYFQRAEADFDRAKRNYDEVCASVMSMVPADATEVCAVGFMAMPDTMHLITVSNKKIEFQVLPIIGKAP